MPAITIRLGNPDGGEAPLAEVDAPDIGSWVRLAPEIALLATNGLSEPCTLGGQIVVVVRAMEDGQVESRICTTAEAYRLEEDTKPKPMMGGVGSLHADAYVLRADGSIER